MKVTLVSFNANALDLLLFTKQTRLALSPGLMDEIAAWPMERKMKELDYMLGTIESSWEFADYVFLVDGVSRAFTHQFVRTREGSYAQQSQRTVDMSGFSYIVPREMADSGQCQEDVTGSPYVPLDIAQQFMKPHGAEGWYALGMAAINTVYDHLVNGCGVPPQDARGVLPTNVSTNIVAKFNLRSLSHMARLRLCTRTQGEYQDVFRLMRDEVIKVHPWAEPFLRVHCAATGVCAFPNYKECPIKGPIFNPATGRRWDEAMEPLVQISFADGQNAGVETDKRPATTEQIQRAWETVRFEARPQQVK